MVNLPPEESAGLRDPAIEKGLDFVPLVAPTSNPERIKQASEAATSFIYYVSITGVTGSKAADLATASERAGALQREVGKPVAIGFGVKTRDDVATVAPHVDGVVVGMKIEDTNVYEPTLPPDIFHVSDLSVVASPEAASAKSSR